MASIFTGEEELFAFERATSRIMEMCTAAYWSASAPPKVVQREPTPSSAEEESRHARAS